MVGAGCSDAVDGSGIQLMRAIRLDGIGRLGPGWQI